MAKHVKDNLIQTNDFVNEQGYCERGQKLASVRLLRYPCQIFLKNIFIFFDRGAFISALPVICKSCNLPRQNYYSAMVRRICESDVAKIEDVDDLDDLVADKRESWRATSDNARRRQRRYKKRLTKRLVLLEVFKELTE